MLLNKIQEFVETALSVAFGWVVAHFGYENLFAETPQMFDFMAFVFELISKVIIATFSATCAYLGVYLLKKWLKHE